MAREQTTLDVSDSGGARQTVALLAAAVLVASAFAPVSTAAVGTGEYPPVVTDAGNTTTTAGNDGTTTAGTNETTTNSTNETTTDGDGTTAVGNDESVTIRGTVTADGDPVANDSMELWSRNRTRTDENRTGERGQYRLLAERNRSYDLTYRQTDASAWDGRPATYAVGRVNASTNLTRNVSLPAAPVRNVTVVAENETSVGNATVALVHERNGANATITGRTDERGRLTVAGRVGVELAGNVTATVEAPNASLGNRTVVIPANETDTEVVLPLNDTDPPTLRYEVAPNPVNVSESVTFDASNSSDESGIRETTWTIAGQPWHTQTLSDDFAEPGNYTVELSATDWAGQTNETTVTVTVVDERAPDPALAANVTTVERNDSVRFDASNATDNYRIETYRWDLDGDGTPEENTTAPNTTHVYAENGTYDATVVVVDAAGNRANATRNVTVELRPPRANFTVSDPTPNINESVTFNASPSTSGGTITGYEWTFEDGPNVQNERVFTTEFPDSGTYDVTLTVSDEYNRTANRTRTVEVPNKQPKADARANGSAVAGRTVALDGSYSTDPDDDLAVEWNQTAGPSVALSNASVTAPTFTAPSVNETRTLRFELTVSDDHGANDTDSVAIAVVPRTRPNVTHSPASPAVNESVTFRANRSGEYRWDFDGDGTPEATPNASNVTNVTATHRFDAAGEYDVTLVDAAGREVVRNVTVVAANDSDAGGGGGTSETGGGSATGDSVDGGTVSGGGSSGGSTGGSTDDSTGGSSSGGYTGGSSGGYTGGGSADSDSVGGSPTGGSTDGDVGDQSTDSSGGQSDATSGDADGERATTVSVERVNEGDDRVLASVEDATADEPATVRLPDGFGPSGSAFESVAVVPDAASNFSLSVAASAERPGKTPRPDAGSVLSYLEVEERDLGNATVASARFRFRVAAERLAEAGVSPDSIRLLRYHDGAWQTLATEVVGERNGTYQFQAVSPGFSVFAIGVEADAASTTTTQTTGSEQGTQRETTQSDDGGDSQTTRDVLPTQSGDNLGGLDDNTVLVGLFFTALVGAALWGYLLS